MKVRAWRVTEKGPLARVSISIGSAGRSGHPEYFFPWVLSLDNARAIFGDKAIGQIGETPVLATLKMKIED